MSGASRWLEAKQSKGSAAAARQPTTAVRIMGDSGVSVVSSVTPGRWPRMQSYANKYSITMISEGRSPRLRVTVASLHALAEQDELNRLLLRTGQGDRALLRSYTIARRQSCLAFVCGCCAIVPMRKRCYRRSMLRSGAGRQFRCEPRRCDDMAGRLVTQQGHRSLASVSSRGPGRVAGATTSMTLRHRQPTRTGRRTIGDCSAASMSWTRSTSDHCAKPFSLARRIASWRHAVRSRSVP